MEPTHKPLPVEGYRPQSFISVDLVNSNKRAEEKLLRHLEDIASQCDPRWLAIGKTHLEQAFMAINRAIFQPARVTLPGDDDAA